LAYLAASGFHDKGISNAIMKTDRSISPILGMCVGNTLERIQRWQGLSVWMHRVLLGNRDRIFDAVFLYLRAEE